MALEKKYRITSVTSTYPQFVLYFITLLWSPYQVNNNDIPNKIQNKFCKLTLFRRGVHVNIQSLTDRRRDF